MKDFDSYHEDDFSSYDDILDFESMQIDESEEAISSESSEESYYRHLDEY